MLAFFDFIDWLDTQATLNTAFDVEQAKKFYGEWLGFLYRLYKALLIDYRLLCSLQAPNKSWLQRQWGKKCRF